MQVEFVLPEFRGGGNFRRRVEVLMSDLAETLESCRGGLPQASGATIGLTRVWTCLLTCSQFRSNLPRSRPLAFSAQSFFTLPVHSD